MSGCSYCIPVAALGFRLMYAVRQLNLKLITMTEIKADINPPPPPYTYNCEHFQAVIIIKTVIARFWLFQ